MKRFGIIVVVMLFFVTGVISFASQVYGQNAKKVLMIPREGNSEDLDLMLKSELGVMNILLKRAGLQVDIATTSGSPIRGQTEKIEKPSRSVDIKLDDYVGVIMPCMAVGAFPGAPVSQETVAIVKRAIADGKPVAPAESFLILPWHSLLYFDHRVLPISLLVKKIFARPADFGLSEMGGCAWGGVWGGAGSLSCGADGGGGEREFEDPRAW